MRSTLMVRLTVQDVDSRESRDVEVSASGDAPLAALLAALPVQQRGRPCYVGATALDPAAMLAGSPLLPGATLSVGGPGPDYHPVRGAAAGTLHVIAGPDAGFGVALPPGRHVIGRAIDCQVCLHDKDVSREHAVIEVSAGGSAVITDTLSRNGTLIGAQRITGPTALEPGTVAWLGGGQLRWVPAPRAALRVSHAPDGRLEFDRVFAPSPAIPAGEVDLPAKGADGRNPVMAILSAMVGVVPGLALFADTHNMLMLVASVGGMVLLPLITTVAESGQRRAAKRSLRRDRQAAAEQAAALAAEEDRVRRLLAPGPAQVAEMATGQRDDLWPRDARSPLGLTLRVGVTDQPASVRLRGETWEGFSHPVLEGVPVTVDLRATGVLGVAGTGEPARAFLRWLVIQLATLRSPDDLRLVLLTSGSGESLRWARWLPHLDLGDGEAVACAVGFDDASRLARVEELGRLITARMTEGKNAPRPGGEVVVVLDGAVALRNLPGIRDILRLGPEAGIYVVCADAQGISECRALCELGKDGVTLTGVAGVPARPATPDALDAAEAERLARALAPMRDRITGTQGEAAIPYPVRLLDLMGMGTPRAADIIRLWQDKKPGPQTRVILGADATGPVTVDVATQGPHAMLGGATGAGKSILLQTLVTALLLANRPDELNLVLVDFKGGGAFLPFENCPHVTALILSTGQSPADTFDEADAARVLASVRAEMSRRESILARYGAEIDNYWRARDRDPSLPRLPRVVMIFDEFARVLDISRDFLKELVSVAGKGRSLGVHLVLATQSLQGKLSPELKNNIDLRISLRQNEPADSVEVLGTPDAAAIPGSLRGRGMILVMKDEARTPRSFQSGYLGDPPPDGGPGQVSVRELALAGLGAPRPPAPKGNRDGRATDQDLVIAAIEEASRQVSPDPPRATLLPALPAQLPLAELPARQTERPAMLAIPYGLADFPDLQAQPPYALDLTAGDRLMVAGGPQSGRTTFARTLITSLAARFPPSQVHLYITEHQPGGLAQYASLPHCGGVFSPAEPDRVRRLVDWLAAETDRRAAARFTEGHKRDPVIVVIIDGWEQFESRADPALADVSLGPRLREVIAKGAPLGIRVVPVGGQDFLNGKVPALCDQRLLLPFPNADTRRAHLRGGMAIPPSLPGRAIDAGNGRHVQVAVPSQSAEQLAAEVSAAWNVAALDPARFPRQFPALPASISVADLALPSPVPSPSWIPLGAGGRDVATIGIDFFEAGPHLMLVTGPPGSGRTTAIATMARLLCWNGTDVLAIAPPQSPLAGMLAGEDGITVVTGAAIEDAALREVVSEFGDRRYAVLLDDADRLTIAGAKKGFAEAPTLLDEIAHPSALGKRALILAGDATPIVSGSRRNLAKVVSEAIQSGTRVLLTPAKRPEARQLNIALEPDQYFARPAGRCYLASGSTTTLIQLAIAAA